MHGAIDLNKIKAKILMKPYCNFCPLEIDAPINRKILEKLASTTYHSIPIYKGRKSNIIGVIKNQELFKIWEGDTIENNVFTIKDPIYINTKCSHLYTLKILEASQDSLGFVINEINGKRKILGGHYKGNYIKFLFKLN